MIGHPPKCHLFSVLDQIKILLKDRVMRNSHVTITVMEHLVMGGSIQIVVDMSFGMGTCKGGNVK